MLEKAGWPEVESEIHMPWWRLALGVGALFVVLPIVMAVLILSHPLPGFHRGFTLSIAGSSAMIGGAVVVTALRNLIWPPRVRHAAPEVLPDVPDEPVVCEGSVVQGGRTHELVENSAGWEFRPKPGLRLAPLWVTIFGFPFLAIFSAAASYYFHVKDNAMGWSDCILRGTLVSLLFVGSILILAALMIRAGHRQLARLSIPRDGDLELDLAEPPDPDKTDLFSAWKWFSGKDRKRLTIPRELVRAVQLCPWFFVMGSDREPNSTRAVQGLLVVAGSAAGRYYRFPILLSTDPSDTARLMQQLAKILQVPYLFRADEAGWQAEMRRVASRPPLKLGGM